MDDSKPRELSLWTIGAISVVAYSLANVLHEGFGHGGACLLTGGRPLMLNAIFFSYDTHTVSPSAVRFIAAGGGLVNLASGLLAIALLRTGRFRIPSVQYFLWLFATTNLLMAFGYFLFSGIMGVGDWILVTAGLASPFLTRLGLSLAGALLYFVAAPKIISPGIARFMDHRRPLEPQIFRLTRFPYLIGGITFVVASLPNPGGLKLILVSAAAASFGGTSLLAWYPFSRSTPPSQAAPLPVTKSPRWIVAAVITLIIFVGVLGPGLRFTR
jgi:hypothetical protein